ncbi:hypothetical protein PHMEG_00034274 [Phytophthora megakarya]|uniref:Peptidase A2 domain-containing protein n=1 Tax=Phytophthora megakarya TaxID=4795 RepID=A0A225URE3_9STRA|nr:hypothetical protein PHMEG_00034274 [Phytophthora megakarya]
MIHDEPVPLDIRQSVSGPPLPPEPEGKPEFKLKPGERYDSWVKNDREEERRQCATVHGAVNNFRTQILLDTGATVSMISLDLARRLKIKLNSQKQKRIKIKITLGWRVVYVMDVWVTNIGVGVGVLLGMDFMFSAGVCLGIREGMVGLPDEESILMYGYTIRRRISQSAPFEDCIYDLEYMQTCPSDMDSVARSKMLYGQDEETNGSPKLFTAHDHGPLGALGYEGIWNWQQIIQENTLSAKARVRQEAYEQMLRDATPPAVMVPKYKWPTELLVRQENLSEPRLRRLWKNCNHKETLMAWKQLRMLHLGLPPQA